MVTPPSIAILGANSHIAKGLIYHFLADGRRRLVLFTRSAAQTETFLREIPQFSGRDYTIQEGYRNFADGNYDAVINCVGAGSPGHLGNDYSIWFTLTEEYDNLCLDYLRNHPKTAYINFSSGAVYGKDGSAPVSEHTVNRIEVNHIPAADYYTIARLNAEAKHRSLPHLNIVDIRIFAYFSRFADLDAGYFITEAVKCTRDQQPLLTSPANMIRDYIHPSDLFVLIQLCLATNALNAAFDAVSSAPVEKFAILDFLKSKYGLHYRIDDSREFGSPNGAKNIYCSAYNRAAEIGYQPKFSAMAAIEQETEQILRR